MNALKASTDTPPDLIQSELAGLAFDSLQQVFRKVDIAFMFDSPPLPAIKDQQIWIVIDPAAGGPQSDYAVISIARQKGCVTVRHAKTQYSSHCSTNLVRVMSSLMLNWTTRVRRKSSRNRSSLA